MEGEEEVAALVLLTVVEEDHYGQISAQHGLTVVPRSLELDVSRFIVVGNEPHTLSIPVEHHWIGRVRLDRDAERRLEVPPGEDSELGDRTPVDLSEPTLANLAVNQPLVAALPQLARVQRRAELLASGAGEETFKEKWPPLAP